MTLARAERAGLLELLAVSSWSFTNKPHILRTRVQKCQTQQDYRCTLHHIQGQTHHFKRKNSGQDMRRVEKWKIIARLFENKTKDSLGIILCIPRALSSLDKLKLHYRPILCVRSFLGVVVVM
ncbi:hypothetical protein AUEXF2481DRAFT_199382 [Aureobasidium subglaciale EXF-2481]|uniref:Uncharacterized protein n=1 Tax=Aureobasidium subglaciale (strain EXF-2481) TaxID=1043005 RepID=A0A074ZN95_AURSE|nr:uncharacterized protein AUEXF2481DRAFT_199382 [Aureobasidium subglaciale EXF-2481]KEQ99841.1 hypothetical protein AUEXF2481DRAFT_199382 [Aureobasidium subglaciale EXF-2481]